jgi:hypothetical protein
MEEGEIVPGRKHKTDLKAIMDDAVMEFLTKNKPRFKLMNVEYEFPKYENLCLLLRETGYIELGSKADEELDLPTVKITQKALDCINSRRYNELFHEAIQYYLFNFNWLYKKGMNEKCEIIQDSALPALFIFTKLSKRSWYPFIDFYEVMIRLYPDIDTCYVKNISIKINKHTYARLFFEELCVYFGLMEHDCEFSKDFLHKPAGNYRTTELYRQYFGWKR